MELCKNSGFHHRTIVNVAKPPPPTFGSYCNPEPNYNKDTHMAKFMVGIERLRSGQSVGSLT